MGVVMKKAAVIAGFFLAVSLGTTATAQAGTSFYFGFSIGGPAVPYGYYYPAPVYPAYPPYYTTYYAYPAYSYRPYVVPRYYTYRSYEPRYYRNRSNAKFKSNGRGRWRK